MQDKWDSGSGSPLMSYEFPNRYPMKHEISTDKRRPKEVTFRLLKETIDTAIKNMMTRYWTKPNVKVYCSVNCLNLLGTQKIVDSVDNKLALDYFSSDSIPEREKVNDKKVMID